MSYTVNVSAYLSRIGYTGSSAPTLETLNTIVSRHVQRIPFENLDILLGRGISIEPQAIEDKLVHGGRGGYCFEHNTLLLHVLEALGFRVSVLSARSRYQPLTTLALPRTHVVLQVELDGQRYLVDGGFGGLSPSAALPLVLGVEQDTPHEPRRTVSEGSWEGLELRAPDALLVHQAYFGDVWHDLFELSLEPMPLADREMGNWYTSAHPRSHFRSRLIAARATSEGRLTLQDRELTFRKRDGSTTKRLVATHAELLEVLEEHFHLRFPEGTRFECPSLVDLA